MSVEPIPIVIVGAGPSGLAVVASLRARGLDAVILDRGEGVGQSWRDHYRRLHLHTPKQLSHLPGLRFGADLPQYPSRQQVVDYLEAFARHHALAPRFGVEVRRASPGAGGWQLETSSGAMAARHLVVASGYNAEPVRPTWEGEADFAGRVLHSRDYRDGKPFEGQRVMVVGAGNSGAEIALDLWESGARVAWSVRHPVNIGPRDPLGLPAQLFGIMNRRLPLAVADGLSRVIIGRFMRGLDRFGLRQPVEGPATLLARDGRVMLLDVGTIDLVRQGQIQVHAGIERFTATGVITAQGGAVPLDAVVLATGYRPRLDRWLTVADQVTDARGHPRWHAAPGGLPGLWFCGFANPISGGLRESRIEARRLARHLGRALSRGAA